MQPEMQPPRHVSGKPKKENAVERKENPGALLEKHLAYYVSPRGLNCYWTRVANGFSIRIDPTLGTLGVTLEPGGHRHALIVDPAYFASLSRANKRCTLIHEFVHAACLHLIRYMRLAKAAPNEKVRKALQAVFNIAADMEANDSYVRLEKDFQETLDEGEFWHLPEQHGLPSGLSMETYMEALIKRLPSVVSKLKEMAKEKETQESEGKSGPRTSSGFSANAPTQQRRKYGSGEEKEHRSPDEVAEDTAKSVSEAAEKYEDLVDQMLGLHQKLNNDTHEKWMQEIADMAETDPAKLQDLIDKAQKEVAQAVKVAHDTTVKLRGKVPGNMARMLESMLVEPAVPWTELLRDWVLGNMGTNFGDTIRLPSYSLLHLDSVEPYPGQVFEPEVNVTWITDTSGSMNDDAFNKAASEMQHLMNQTKAVRCHHIQVDTVIQNETLHGNNDTDITAQMRYGYGGTKLVAAFARAVNVDLGMWREDVEKLPEVRMPDMMVVFTDGYIEDMHPVMEAYHPGCPTLWLITPGGQVPAAVQQLGAPHVAIVIPR